MHSRWLRLGHVGLDAGFDRLGGRLWLRSARSKVKQSIVYRIQEQQPLHFRVEQHHPWCTYPRHPHALRCGGHKLNIYVAPNGAVLYSNIVSEILLGIPFTTVAFLGSIMLLLDVRKGEAMAENEFQLTPA